MEEEFHVANSKKIFLIPVCSTGGISEKLWEKIHSNLDLYGYTTPELKSSFEKLKNLNPENNKNELLDVLFKIMSLF